MGDGGGESKEKDSVLILASVVFFKQLLTYKKRQIQTKRQQAEGKQWETKP